MIVNLDALKKRYTGSSSSGCKGCQSKYRLIQQLLSELTDVEDLRSQLAAKERECEELRRQLAIDPMFDETDALLGGEKGEGR